MGKLTVENHTRYDTHALKAVVRACEEYLGLKCSRRAIFKYSKKSMLWGHASYPHGYAAEGMWAEFFLPGDPALFDFTHFALLVEHELLHNKGLKHGGYGNIRAHYPRRHAGEVAPDWAAALAVRGVPFKAPVKKVVDPESRIVKRASEVSEKVAYWERKLALAKTKLKKYYAKQRYYEKALSPEAVAERAARPKTERKPRTKKLKLDAHGGNFVDASGIKRYWIHVSPRVWEEIQVRILDVDFDESMADVQAMKEDIQKHHSARKSHPAFAIRLEHFRVLARELRDMQGFDSSPDRALERAAEMVQNFEASFK